MPTKQTLSSVLKNAREYCRQGDAHEAKLLYLLLKLETNPNLWKKDYPTWEHLLRQEGLCTPNRYRKFKTASKVFNKEGFRKFGVSACLLIARTPKGLRGPILEEATRWWQANKIPLTGQRASQIIRKFHPTFPTNRINAQSKLVTIRMPHELQASLRALATDKGTKWQTLTKDLLAESLGLESAPKTVRAHAKRLEALLLFYGIKPPGIEENDDVVTAAAEFIRAKHAFQELLPSCPEAALTKTALKLLSADLKFKKTDVA